MLQLVILAVAVCNLQTSDAAGKDFYIAAVFEHARFGTYDDTPELVVQTNLEYYATAAAVAKSKGVDILVFPEYGIFYPGLRKQLKPFLETIPDPRIIRATPCDHPDLFSSRPILYQLSCMAKNHSMFIVANMGDIQDCTGQYHCPLDGVFQYNTNVVFDRNGTLVMKYYKEHLFDEIAYNPPNEPQNATFDTDFGTFATFICFDIDWSHMRQVARRPDVEGIAFSTFWFNQPPVKNSIQLWEAFAIGNDATILAANLQIPFYFATGSGIFTRDGALAYTLNPDNISKLVVAKVPKMKYRGRFQQTAEDAQTYRIKLEVDHSIEAPENGTWDYTNLRPDISFKPESSITAIAENGTWNYNNDGKAIPDQCSMKEPKNVPSNDFSQYRCVEEDLSKYNIVKLTEPSGTVTACSNGMCCSVEYSASNMTENFFLGVFNGTKIFSKFAWCEESCFLARCDPSDSKPCRYFSSQSHTNFRHLRLFSNYTSDTYIFPSVVSTRLRVVPKEMWDYRRSGDGAVVNLVTGVENFLAVGLVGRCYSRDPPYAME